MFDAWSHLRLGWVVIKPDIMQPLVNTSPYQTAAFELMCLHLHIRGHYSWRCEISNHTCSDGRKAPSQGISLCCWPTRELVE